MKPLFLQMTAFGPFATTQSIHFADLGDNPLFLINGPTGAGKTSILDAMAFALYGKTTGDRSADAMRCHHAAIDVETEVVFIFALANKVYRVDRKPTQTTKAKRGDGLTTRQASANLYQVTPDEKQSPMGWPTTLLSSNSVTQANAKVEQLIGLNDSQFRQVVVLPQGQFRELLVANSQSREAILASLFQTETYKRIEEAVAERAKSVNDDYQRLKQNLASLLTEIGYDTIEQLDIAIAEQKVPLQQASANLQAIKAAHDQVKSALTRAEELEKRFQNLRAHQQQLMQLDHQREQIVAQELQIAEHEKANKLLPAWNDLHKAEQQLKARKTAYNEAMNTRQQALEDLDGARARVREVAEHPKKIEKLVAEISQLNAQMKQLEQLHSLQQQRNDINATWQQIAQQLAQSKAQKERLLGAYDNAEKELARVQKSIDQHINIDAMRTKLEHQIKLARSVQGLSERREGYAQDIEKITTDLQTAETELNAATQQSKTLQLQWYTEQASALAHELQPGQPCMVCGSKEHPQPAHSSDVSQLVSQAQLDQAEIAVQSRRQRVQQIEQERAGKVQQVQELESRYRELVEELGVAADRPLGILVTELNQLEDTERQQVQQREQYNTLIKQLKQLQSDLSDQQRGNEQLQQSLQQHENRIAGLDGQIRVLDPDQTLVTASLESLKSHHEQQQAKRERLQSEQKNVEQLMRDREQQCANACNSADIAKRELNLAEQQFSLGQAQWQSELNNSTFTDNSAFQHALLTPAEAERMATTIRDYQRRRITIESLIEQEQKAIGKQVQPNLEQLQQQQKAVAQQESEQQAVLDTLTKRMSILEHAQQSFRRRERAAQELVEEYKVIGELAQTLSGDNESRISLQRFVLAVLLDDVLHEASVRLQQMTANRFSLIRGQDVGDRRKHSGLELMINDSYTGQEREVNTLSGGESFMAALALALGLSDVVQSYAGGIRIETLFIDEGFGSLDSEALDLAIDVLASLRASGRTIGIISHVHELKQRIHKRIDVIREANGSYLKMK